MKGCGRLVVWEEKEGGRWFWEGEGLGYERWGEWQGRVKVWFMVTKDVEGEEEEEHEDEDEDEIKPKPYPPNANIFPLADTTPQLLHKPRPSRASTRHPIFISPSPSTLSNSNNQPTESRGSAIYVTNYFTNPSLHPIPRSPKL